MADEALQTSTGGQITTTHSTTAAADILLYTGSGRFCQLSIITGGTTFTRYWDTSTTSGAATAVQIFCTANTTTSSTGALTSVQMPFANGLLVNASAGSIAGCTVTINKNTPLCR